MSSLFIFRSLLPVLSSPVPPGVPELLSRGRELSVPGKPEGLARSPRDLLADGEGCGRGRRGSVEDMQGARPLEDEEVIDELARGVERLRTHARSRLPHIFPAHLRHEPLESGN